MDDHALRDKMIVDRVEHTLERIIKEAIVNNPNSIIPTEHGFSVFGRYTIVPEKEHFSVYRGATLAAQPSSKKLALAWCIADKLGKFSLTQELTLFDQEIERRKDEIKYFRHYIEKHIDSNRVFVLEDRLRHSLIRLKWLQEQLDKCVNMAKYWQQKGFKDETARIGLKTQNSTNT